MALSGDILGQLIKANIDAQALVDPTDRDALFKAMGNAIVSHITANAQVISTVTVVSVGGVTPGPGTSGSGAGTGTGTII